MSTSDLWVFGIALFIIPLFFWLRVRDMNRRKAQVTARCKHCHTDQRLPSVKNFHCTKCGKENRFYDDEGTPLFGTKTYRCEACQSINFVGIPVCTACGKGNPQGVPA